MRGYANPDHARPEWQSPLNNPVFERQGPQRPAHSSSYPMSPNHDEIRTSLGAEAVPQRSRDNSADWETVRSTPHGGLEAGSERVFLYAPARSVASLRDPFSIPEARFLVPVGYLSMPAAQSTTQLRSDLAVRALPPYTCDPHLSYRQYASRSSSFAAPQVSRDYVRYVSFNL